jgi:hypothetical protein
MLKIKLTTKLDKIEYILCVHVSGFFSDERKKPNNPQEIVEQRHSRSN